MSQNLVIVAKYSRYFLKVLSMKVGGQRKQGLKTPSVCDRILTTRNSLQAEIIYSMTFV
jgi:hypothetical protein